MRATLVGVVLATVVAAGCLGASPDPAESWRFVEVGDRAGFERPIGEVVTVGGAYFQSVVGGVSAADVDDDGWTDLFVADVGPNHLYLNQGDGTFREAADEAGVAGFDPTMQALLFDHDGDGDPDLFLANYGNPSQMFENRGDGTFREVTDRAGVGNASDAYGAAAVDVDGDGDLDFSVVNYGRSKGPPGSYTNATDGPRDYLYVNRGDGTFTEEGLERGLHATRYTLSHAWADHDGDGDPDLYVNVDFGYDVLYENDGSGNFTEATREAGTVTDENGMGAHWVDVDDDLDLDLFTTNIHIPDLPDRIDHFEGNDLFLQQEDGTFREAADEAGVRRGGWGWDSAWADFDHDGDVDGYQANGLLTRHGTDIYYDTEVRLADQEPEYSRNRFPLGRYNDSHWLYIQFPEDRRVGLSTGSIAGNQSDRFFLNTGDGTFRGAAADVGLGEREDTRAAATLDLDHDGDLDLAHTAFKEPLRLAENRAVEAASDGDAHWLQVDLEGTTSNRDAVGARLVAEAGDRTLLRHVTAGGGFMSQDQHALHLGLGNATKVDALRITWPSGQNATLEDVAADQTIRVTEPDDLETGIWARG